MTLSLFCRGDLHDFLEERKRQAVCEVGSVDADTLVSNAEDVCRALVGKFKLELPVLNREAMQASCKEADIPFVGRRPGVSYAKGTRVTVTIPFTGDQELFYLRPSQFSLAPPEAEVTASELRLTLETTTHDDKELRREIEGTLDAIGLHLANAKEQVDRFHPELEREVEGAVIARKKRLLEQRGMMERLGIPDERSS